MKELIQFEIYFEDLTEIAQHYLCKTFKTTPEKENWENIPLAFVARELEAEEKEKG